MWITRQDRLTLCMLGAAALAALAILVWQQQRPALIVSGESISAEALHWDGMLADVREINLNTAGIRELERLPHVGPTLAARIVAYRNEHGRFRNPEELVRVQGIGPKTYEAIQGYVTIE